ncbi:hypothetical protein [Zooshikella sp. RANM57]|uniref:hypothetical protein n=1 Tax=Zooshikella sp. RANM57 TaxID=3425863 RepID=UPI003D6EEC81
MKIIKLLSIGLIIIPTLSIAEDKYELGIPWWGGYGQKTVVNCSNTYFANSIANYDHGNNDQSAYKATCQKMSDFLSGYNVSHTACVTQHVSWWGGAGYKTWSYCPDGKYAVGFANYDYGNNDQSVNQMRCCGIVDGPAQHSSSYVKEVLWWGGKGAKTPSDCDPGYFITGIRNIDYGNNDQAVVQIKCTMPQP